MSAEGEAKQEEEEKEEAPAPAAQDKQDNNETPTTEEPMQTEEPGATAAGTEEEKVTPAQEEQTTQETKATQEETVGTEASEPAPTEATGTASTGKPAVKEKDFLAGGEPINEPTEFDVLNGRGASVNAHKGNQRFRALCFQRKPEFEAGNHAAKRRIATEIVGVTKGLPGRFLKKREKQGPWFELTTEKSILKACQVMRDFERPDRVQLREMARLNAKKRNRTRPPSTPMPDTPASAAPVEPIIENPFGVHDHDVLSGRGAYVNGHVGNQRFRKLALERKAQFESGNYSEKRALATEIVGLVRSLDPPGRFLKRVTKKDASGPKDGEAEESMTPQGLDGSWEELTDDKAIHKACQVMRDIDRPDRGPDRKPPKKGAAAAAPTEPAEAAKDSITMLAETTAAEAASTVEEVVAAAEAALDTVMDGVSAVPPPQATPAEATAEEAKAEAKAAAEDDSIAV